MAVTDISPVNEPQILFEAYKKKRLYISHVGDTIDAYTAFMEHWKKSDLNLKKQYRALLLNEADNILGHVIVDSDKLKRTHLNALKKILRAYKPSTIILATNRSSDELFPSEEDGLSYNKLLNEMVEDFKVEIRDVMRMNSNEFFSYSDNGIKTTF